MICLLLDILIYNLTPYSSYFFLEVINHKKYVCVFIVAFILDFIILKTYYINIIVLTLLYLLKKYDIKINYNNFIYYLIFNVFSVTFYYLIVNLIFNYLSIKNYISILIINIIFIMISYIKERKCIKLFR